MNGRRIQFRAPSSGGRLDLTLVGQIPDLSRTRLQRLIRDGMVRVDGLVITKPGFALGGGELVETLIHEPKPPSLQPEPIPLDIIFENKDLLIVNKPAGMVVHPSLGHETGTLIHAALAYAPDISGVGGERRPGIIHRLDKDTSGLILLAKTDAAHRMLQTQFKKREVKKRYLALVDGRPPTPSGRIEAPVGRDSRHRKKMAVVPPGKGREAFTTYRALEDYHHHTLLEAHPETGRTHQVRVHLAFINCPVVGDRTYGRKSPTLPIDRHFLHAAGLSFILPGEETGRHFEVPLPPELEIILDNLRSQKRRTNGMD